jgi:hypothetical protein
VYPIYVPVPGTFLHAVKDLKAFKGVETPVSHLEIETLHAECDISLKEKNISFCTKFPKAARYIHDFIVDLQPREKKAHTQANSFHCIVNITYIPKFF